ncbi:MAG: hypothetical protein ABFD50_08250 [Smithella sp.]
MVPYTGCKYDTDNDGNCHLHPDGCPLEITENQAEKLAEGLFVTIANAQYDYVRSRRSNPKTEMVELIKTTINQATSELRADYNLLKDTYAGGDYFVTEMRKMRKENERLKERVAELQEKLDANLQATDRLYEYTDKFKTENERLKAQVAGLVEALKFYSEPSNFTVCTAGDFEDEIEMKTLEPQDIIENYSSYHHGDFGIKASETLADLQATADAYTANVREESVRECLNVVSEVVTDSHFEAMAINGGTNFLNRVMARITKSFEVLISDKKVGSHE